MTRRLAMAAAMLVLLGSDPRPARAGQDPTAGAQASGEGTPTAVPPIECWWRTSASSVRVGELFDVVLTCAVIETTATTVVPDESRLDPSVVQLPPFEVTGGSHPADLRTRSRRFFQYEYTLRYLGEDFGRDLALPSLTLGYRVQNRVEAGGAAIESRDRQYLLPQQTLRVVSLVPAGASDIRDRAPDTFASIAARRFRANVLRIIAMALFAVSAAVLAAALIRALRHRKGRTAGPVRLASDGAILRQAVRQLEAVDRQRRIDGWTTERLSRALAALRIAASYATTGRVSQTSWTPDLQPGDGELVVRSFWRPGRAAVVSASATAATLERDMRRRERGNAHRSGPLTDLHPALAQLDAAAYGRPGAPEADLDEAMASGLRGARAVRRQYGGIRRRLRALLHSAGAMRTRQGLRA
jgi:hypothetical protein